MRKTILLAGVVLMMAACENSEQTYDATGTFEATETTVFAEQSGVLLTFNINEGDSIGQDTAVGSNKESVSEPETRYGTPDCRHTPATG